MLSKIRSGLPLDVRRHVIAQHLTPYNSVDTISDLLFYCQKFVSGTGVPVGMPDALTLYFKKNLCVTLIPNPFVIIVRIHRVHGTMNLSLGFLVERNRFSKTNLLRFLFFVLDHVPLDPVKNQVLLYNAHQFTENMSVNARSRLRLYIHKTLKHATVDPEWLGTAKKSILFYSKGYF